MSHSSHQRAESHTPSMLAWVPFCSTRINPQGWECSRALNVHNPSLQRLCVATSLVKRSSISQANPYLYLLSTWTPCHPYPSLVSVWIPCHLGQIQNLRVLEVWFCLLEATTLPLCLGTFMCVLCNGDSLTSSQQTQENALSSSTSRNRDYLVSVAMATN